MMQMNNEHVVSNQDLKNIETQLEKKIDKLDAKLDRIHLELKAEISGVRIALTGDINSLKSRVTSLQWMLGFIIAGIASLIIKSFFT